jgi:hypothetical protein
VEVVVAIRIEVPTGVVVSERDVWARIGAIHEGLASGALKLIVVVAVDSLAERFWDENALAPGVNLTGVPLEACAPDAGEVVVIICCAAYG